MKHPKNLGIKDFTYELPDDRIARFPLPQRDDSKLAIWQKGVISADIYKNLPGHLPGGSMLVFNNTRVVEARLLFQKTTGAQIEVFCLEPTPEYPDITTAMRQQGSIRYKCLIGGASKWKHGMVLTKSIATSGFELELKAAIVDRQMESFVVEFSWQPANLAFAEVLHYAGNIPLPPYLHRAVEQSDAERYQTIYAHHEGSVAAPTAGLHFTPGLFAELEKNNILKEFVTLHVSAGTFKPVNADKVGDHLMHSEFIDVQLTSIRQISLNLHNGIVAVGTTSLRTLESLYWMGVKIGEAAPEKVEDAAAIAVHQWDPYELPGTLTPGEALNNLANWMEFNGMERLITRTSIMIAPGYKLKVATALLTNFHQPQSTLLLLIAAITGDDWKRIYEYAMENEFRFLSYGDGCLLFADHEE